MGEPRDYLHLYWIISSRSHPHDFFRDYINQREYMLIWVIVRHNKKWSKGHETWIRAQLDPSDFVRVEVSKQECHNELYNEQMFIYLFFLNLHRIWIVYGKYWIVACTSALGLKFISIIYVYTAHSQTELPYQTSWLDTWMLIE